MEMLNEKAIRIIEEIPVETDEQKAALELAKEALKSYKCIEIAPVGDKIFDVFRQNQILRIYCKTEKDMDSAIAIIKEKRQIVKKEMGERNG